MAYSTYHIDDLLVAPGVEIEQVLRFDVSECEVNRMTEGRIVVARLGASDCRAGCGSHLKLRPEGPGTSQAC
ncbi:uncharacterized protein sS8_3990 [Methylocaldum marinum]|uniref:Uncharacterized protein n=1 Tax=Methylocaldum marinum TaxID=1432792 RepID=A0A250KY58_9GAMM|nr:DUF123 domain-containing protein [Methylocaldum marinum]BBA35921.1 uncharacterized protein sS8_3990 [Methylocaldum marinum]